jgi:hypothetical protein
MGRKLTGIKIILLEHIVDIQSNSQQNTNEDDVDEYSSRASHLGKHSLQLHVICL